VVALAGVTGLNTLVLTHVIAALLTPFCLLVPFWLI
jgi:lactate permease